MATRPTHLAGLVVLAFLALTLPLSGSASAQGGMTWYLEDVVFDSGATAHGSIDYDETTDTWSNPNIQVLDSPAYGQPVMTFLSPDHIQQPREVVVVPEVPADMTGVPLVVLRPDVAPTNAGGTVPLETGVVTYLGTCNEPCSTFSGPFEGLVSGRLTTERRTWFVEGLAFDTGATGSGSYTFDAAANTVSDMDVTVVGSPALGTTVYGDPNPNHPSWSGYLHSVEQASADMTNVPGVLLPLDGNMTHAGGVVAIIPFPTSSSGQGRCQDATCSSVGGTDLVDAGRVSTSRTPPAITSAGTASAPENQTAVIDVEATDDLDAEGNGLTYAITGGVDQASFAIDVATGVLTFDPAPDFEDPRDAGTDNVYDVQVTASDLGGLTDVQDIAVTVTGVEEAPTADAGADATIAEGSDITLDGTASTDPEQSAASLTYRWDFDEDGIHTDATGATPTFTGPDGPDTITVGLEVEDATGRTDRATVDITITNADPVITAVTDDGPVDAGSPATITVTATDPAAADDPLSYAFDCDGDATFEVGPQAANSTTCTFATAGGHPVDVRVADDDGGLATGSTTVTVTDPSAPVVTPVVPAPGGLAGWHVADVAVTWNVSDAESAVTTTTGCGQTDVTSDTTGQVVTCEATSSGGTTTSSVTITRDATVPDVVVTGANDGDTYANRSAPTPGCDTTDTTSGVQTAAVVTTTGANPDGSGTITATCSGAALPASITYRVLPRPPSTAPTLAPVVEGSSTPGLLTVTVTNPNDREVTTEPFELTVHGVAALTLPESCIADNVDSDTTLLTCDVGQMDAEQVVALEIGVDGTGLQAVDVTGPDGLALQVQPSIPEDPAVLAELVSSTRFASLGTRGADERRVAAHVVLSRDDVFADSLAGSVLLGDGPLLFSASGALDDDTLAEIDRVLGGSGTVHLLGGPAALSADVAARLTDAGYTVNRLAGPSRVETAIAIADFAVDETGAPTQVAIARADAPADSPSAAWVDAITAGAWAADSGQPVLLTSTSDLHPATRDWLAAAGQGDVVVLGGQAAVSEEVETALVDAGHEVTRIDGATRFETAVAVADRLWASPAAGRVLAAGELETDWAHALALAGVAADRDQPLLLTLRDQLPEPTGAALCSTDGPRPYLLGVPDPAAGLLADLAAIC